MRKGLIADGRSGESTAPLIDMDTINLSYGMRCPSSMLKTSDKLEAQVNDGIVLSMKYSSVEISQHKYSNGTHQHLKYHHLKGKLV